jgi:hypothetical protein
VEFAGWSARNLLDVAFNNYELNTHVLAQCRLSGKENKQKKTKKSLTQRKLKK